MSLRSEDDPPSVTESISSLNIVPTVSLWKRGRMTRKEAIPTFDNFPLIPKVHLKFANSFQFISILSIMQIPREAIIAILPKLTDQEDRETRNQVKA